MTLVEVDDAGVEAHCVEDAHRADPEQRVLGEPRRPVGDVQPAGDPLVDGGVLRALRVEKVQRRATDIEPPHLHDDVAPAQRDRDRQRHVRRCDKSGRNTLRVDLEPVLELISGSVHALLEVPLAVEESDADHRQRHVRRLLEDVACQHAQTAGVDRQGSVHRELGTEKGHRVLGARPALHGRTAQLVIERGEQLGEPVEQRAISCGAFERRGRGLVEEADGVVVARLPSHGVDHPEDVVPTRPPRPRVVVCEPCERFEWRRQPRREVRGRAVDVLAAVCEGRRLRARSRSAAGPRSAPPQSRDPPCGPPGCRNTAVPATRTSAPASTHACALVASTPPSTSTSVSRPWRSTSARMCSTLRSVRGISDCPPNPGSMVITSARSHDFEDVVEHQRGRAGLIAAPARQSSARMDERVRCRFGHAS